MTNKNLVNTFKFYNEASVEINVPSEMVQQELITYVMTDSGVKKTTVKRTHKYRKCVESYYSEFIEGESK